MANRMRTTVMNGKPEEDVRITIGSHTLILSKGVEVALTATYFGDDDNCDCGRDNTWKRCKECGQRLCQDCEDTHTCC